MWFCIPKFKCKSKFKSAVTSCPSPLPLQYARWEHWKPLRCLYSCNFADSELFLPACPCLVQYARRWEHLKPVWFCIVSCHLLWFTFTKAVINVSIIAPLTGKMLGFKVTGAKNAAAAANGADSKPKRRICSGGCFSWLKPKYLGDMAGTWDHYVLLVSFLLSFITAAVGIFGIIDKPYTAQGEVRWFLLLSVFWAIHNMVSGSACVDLLCDVLLLEISLSQRKGTGKGAMHDTLLEVTCRVAVVMSPCMIAHDCKPQRR